jgi:hypothetical protein
MQLLMRRPEISAFITIAPPASMHDFSFLAPCPASGLIIHGDKDELVPIQQATLFMDKLKAAGVPGELVVKEGAGHGWAKPEVEIELMAVFFDKHLLGKGKESP